ncbi:MAG: SDR family oxidoreductase [Alphaproteobacteria bacterium]|nr:SDR family oxidoreductase [Alphaproteobacteria bacterium]
MDLGIKGRRAIVCAASKGLGKGCAMALAREGVDLVINARTAADVDATAAEIRSATGVKVTAVACDVTSVDGRNRVLAACPEPDIVINNAGGPPPGDFRDWGRDEWIKAIDANMLTPIEFIKATVDGMMKRGFGRIVNITSSSVKAPIDILGLSNGARSGLTGFVAGVARTTVRHGVTINGLLPGPFATDRLKGTYRSRAQKSGKSFEEEYAAGARANPAGRFGTAEEFGAMCAFLCSVHAGYMTGQNILMDGGQYPGTY